MKTAQPQIRGSTDTRVHLVQVAGWLAPFLLHQHEYGRHMSNTSIIRKE